MPRTTRENKIANYRKALEMKKANPQKSWTPICQECGSSSRYIYVDPDKVTDRQLDHISYVISLMDRVADVKLAFRDIFMKDFNLIDPLSEKEFPSFKFEKEDFSDKELLQELKRRGFDGPLRREKRVVEYEPVEW